MAPSLRLPPHPASARDGDPGVAAQIGPYFVVSLDLGATKAFGLRLVSTPRTKTRPRGPRFWPNFRSQRCPPVYVDTP